MLTLCRFYRYLVYRLYHFKNDTPIFNVILALTLTHGFHVMIFLVLTTRFTSFDVWPHFSSFMMKVAPVLFGFLNYFLFYNKKQWASFDEEFKNETSEQKHWGGALVLAYLIGAPISFFVITLIVYECI